MTILAQFNDCHCCNDARSLVQKKSFLRFLRCLRFAKPRYTERTLRRVQFHVSQVSPFARYHCLRVYLASISFFALDSRWNHTHYIIGHQPFVFFLLNNLGPFLLGCSTEPSRSDVGAFRCDFTRALFLTTCATKSQCWDVLCLVLLFKWPSCACFCFILKMNTITR